jgi:Carboxypeptidase regulatory-like domain/TonB dependent receptor
MRIINKMRTFQFMRNFVATALVVGALSGVLLAQAAGTGSIEGTVTDPSGAVVSGALVTANNSATGSRTVATTTESGSFVVPLLQPGPYTVTVAAPGFETVTQEHVIVDALAKVTLNPRLSVGTASQSVTVTGETTMLATDDVKLGSAMENDVYDSLPLAMNGSARDPSAFAGLAVGVNSYSVQAAGPSTGSFNGGQLNQNEGYIEGLPMTSAGTEGETRNLAFGISVEAVEQFQVATTGSEAMYDGQGVSNYIVKSGTNRFHGGVFEYFRNTIFDANGFFAKSTPVEHQNEFGGSIGGPILKDKLFFFANYDGYRFDSAIPPSLQTIPTAAERTGDFSAFPIAIYDPTTCTSMNASGQCTGRTQFSYNGVLNVIPPSRISKVAQSFQSSLPTNFASGGIANNYLATLPNLVNNDSTTAKVDYNISEKNRIFAVFSKGKYANPIVGSLSAATSTTNSTLPVPYTDGRGVIEYATLGQIHETYSIRPNLLNDFGYSVSRLFIPLTSNTASGNYPSKAGLTGLPPGIASTGFPDITFTGNDIPVSWDGTNSHAFNEAQTTFTAQDNLLWSKNKHHFTFGFQWQALQDNENLPLTGTQAGFTFGPNETANFTAAGAINPATGLAYASYLLGAVDNSTVVQNAVIETGGRYKTYSPYVQDDIQVSPRLTVNLGLRYDLWGTFTEVQNNMSFFNPNVLNPVAGNIPGALQFAGNGTDSCHCADPVKEHDKNFAPRVGIAYRLTDTTVLRGSYGMFYAHTEGTGGRGNSRQGLSQLGFDNSGNLATAVSGQPAYSWDSGYPGNPINPPFINPSYGIGFISKLAPGAAAIGAGPTTAQTMVYGDPNIGGIPSSYQDWSLNVQHSFTPNMTFSIAYAGSGGHHLPGAGVAGPLTNQIPVQYLPLQGLLTTTLTPASLLSAQAVLTPLGITIPWAAAGTPFPFFTGQIGQALRPFPQYGAISNPYSGVGNSSYNALQVSLNRRMSNGLTFMVNYTWSKELDDLSGGVGNGTTVRYPGADRLEYAPGTVDRAHVATATFVYGLPFGAGRRWGGGNRILSQIIGKWQLSGIFTFSTGAPLTITGTCNGGNVSGGNVIDALCIPNVTPGFAGSVWQNGKPTVAAAATSTHFLNKAAFTDPAPYTFGNAARTAPYGIFAPHVADVDISVRREFPIRESLRFALQADAFNISNSVFFAAPNTNIDSSSFGTFTSQANQARKLQLSARITF